MPAYMSVGGVGFTQHIKHCGAMLCKARSVVGHSPPLTPHPAHMSHLIGAATVWSHLSDGCCALRQDNLLCHNLRGTPIR